MYSSYLRRLCSVLTDALARRACYPRLPSPAMKRIPGAHRTDRTLKAAPYGYQARPAEHYVASVCEIFFCPYRTTGARDNETVNRTHLRKYGRRRVIVLHTKTRRGRTSRRRTSRRRTGRRRSSSVRNKIGNMSGHGGANRERRGSAF